MTAEEEADSDKQPGPRPKERQRRRGPAASTADHESALDDSVFDVLGDADAGVANTGLAKKARPLP
eukprot:9127725-Alexandrium_andersonii.AAC.1